jgi:predicted nicotinamide N-methyase
MERVIILKIHVSGSDEIKHLRFRGSSATSFVDIEGFVKRDLSLDDRVLIEWYSEESKQFALLQGAHGVVGSARILTLYVNRVGAAVSPPLLIKGREFDTASGIEISGKIIKIADYSGNREAGTGLNTWDGSVVLAKYFERCAADTLRGRRVLELGAGTGLGGIAAHALGARMTVLTDLEYALGNLRENVRVNFEHFESVEAGPVFVRRLDWFDETTYIWPSDVAQSCDECDDHWDVVVGADIVWLEELVPALVDCLEAVMKPKGRRVSHEKLNIVGYLSHQVYLHAIYSKDESYAYGMHIHDIICSQFMPLLLLAVCRRAARPWTTCCSVS